MLIPLKVISVVAAFVSDSSMALSVNISSSFCTLPEDSAIMLLSTDGKGDYELLEELLELDALEEFEELAALLELEELDALDELDELAAYSL